jgi:hypothetical protein
MISGRLKLAGLHPEVKAAAEWCLKWADHYQVPVTVTSGFRSWIDQDRLYRKYLAGESRFPANPPGTSAHNYGLAWDSWTPPEYREWWEYVRRMAGFDIPSNDWIHAAVPNWRAYVHPDIGGTGA